MIRLRTTAGLAESDDYGGRKLWLVAATAQVKRPSSEVVKPTREGGSPLGLPMGRMSISYPRLILFVGTPSYILPESGFLLFLEAKGGGWRASHHLSPLKIGSDL